MKDCYNRLPPPLSTRCKEQIPDTEVPAAIGRERYGALDGLRSYSMIGIIIMHIRAFIPYHKANVIGTFSYFVALFMMISAFSMCCGYYERIKKGHISPSAFYARRYLRILPYFAFLCLIDLIVHPSVSSLYEFFANITLCFGLLPNSEMEMMGLGWFIGLIFVFYLIFPFFVFMMDNKRRAWISLVCTIAFSVISITYFYKPPFYDLSISKSTHNIIYYMPYFVAGGLIFLYKDKFSSLNFFMKSRSAIWAILISIGYFVAIDNTKNEYLCLFLTLAIFSFWVVYAISYDSRVLDNKYTRFFSEISLEMYLAQMFVFRPVQMLHLENYIRNDTACYLLICITTLVILIPFTYITKHYIVDKLVCKFVK